MSLDIFQNPTDRCLDRLVRNLILFWCGHLHTFQQDTTRRVFLRTDCPLSYLLQGHCQLSLVTSSTRRRLCYAKTPSLVRRSSFDLDTTHRLSENPPGIPTGPLPRHLCNLVQLTHLFLGNNHFKGVRTFPARSQQDAIRRI